jgi:hypothetical protein
MIPDKPNKVTEDFVVQHRYLIEEARASKPLTLKANSPRRKVVEMARVHCGYSATTSTHSIWEALTERYRKLYLFA